MNDDHPSDRQLVCSLLCAYGHGDLDGAEVLSVDVGWDALRLRTACLDLCASLLLYMGSIEDKSPFHLLVQIDDPSEHVHPGPHDFPSSIMVVAHYLLEGCSDLHDGSKSTEIQASLYDVAWQMFRAIGVVWDLDAETVASQITLSAAEYGFRE